MKLKFYIGLTKDFRSWKIVSTTGDPNYAFDNKYVWFYGPFTSKQEAEQYKKSEALKNPKRRWR